MSPLHPFIPSPITIRRSLQFYMPAAVLAPPFPNIIHSNPFTALWGSFAAKGIIDVENIAQKGLESRILK